MIFMSKFTTEQISELNDKLKTPEEVLQWGLENIHPKLALASSFGAEDVCVIHMLSKINPEARVFFIRHRKNKSGNIRCYGSNKKKIQY